MSKDRGNQRLIPTIRFKGFTDDWEQRKLGELADIARGASPRPIQDPKWFDDSSQVGWLRIADVTEQNGRIHHLEQHISKLGQEKTRVLAKPHLLLSIAATVGKPVVNYVKTGVHDGFLIFYDLKANREFVYQWLEMFRPLWQKYGQPGSQVNLNSELVKQQPIPLPSNDEQEKIVNILASLDDTIALHQRKYENLQAVKKELLKRMFASDKKPVPDFRFNGYTNDWEQRKFFGVIQKTIDFRGRTPRKMNAAWTTSGHLALSALNVKNGYIDYSSDPHYGDDALYHRWMDGNELCKDDVLFTMEAPAGNVALVPDDQEYILSQRTVAFRTNKQFMTQQFLAVLMSTPEFQASIKSLSTGGTAQGISQKSLRFLTIKYPSNLAEQDRISGLVINLNGAIALHQRKLEDLKQLKKVLLQKLFV